METRVLLPTEDALLEAAQLLKEGSLVGIPTETVYGLGANALNAEAVKHIFEAKGRPGDNPLIVHISELEEIYPLISGGLSDIALKLAEQFWPGPLTMIFPKSDLVPMRTTGNLNTVAIRMPEHPIARKLIKLSGIPIAAPSGNRSGRPSPTTAAHMLEDMNGIIPMIIDGGACGVGVESTVLDMTGSVPRVLRPGGVTPEMIRDAAGKCEVDPAVMRPLAKGETARSPGMKYRHYAPEGTLTLYHGDPVRVVSAIIQAYDQSLSEGHRPLILAMEDHLQLYDDRRVESLGLTPEDMAKCVFGALRDADSLGADVILSESTEATGIGLAVMNRLGRAAAFHTIEV